VRANLRAFEPIVLHSIKFAAALVVAATLVVFRLAVNLAVTFAAASMAPLPLRRSNSGGRVSGCHRAEHPDRAALVHGADHGSFDAAVVTTAVPTRPT
jgi:hypothetical protein